MVQSLKERLEWQSFQDGRIEVDIALEQVKKWLQDQFLEYYHDDWSSRKNGIVWAASYLGDKTCPTCIGLKELPKSNYGVSKKDRTCPNCGGKGSIDGRNP